MVLFIIGGRELFANQIYYYDNNSINNHLYMYNSTYNNYGAPANIKRFTVRENFDDNFNSLVTVFLLIIGDNWPDILYEYMKFYYTSSFLYFIGVVIIGNIFLFNIFLSIMITNYDEEYAVTEEVFDLKNQENDKKLRKNINARYNMVKSKMKLIMNCVKKNVCWICCCLLKKIIKKGNKENNSNGSNINNIPNIGKILLIKIFQ